jgi:hypothetical protein
MNIMIRNVVFLAVVSSLVSCANQKMPVGEPGSVTNSNAPLPSHIEVITVSAPGVSAASLQTMGAELQRKGWRCTTDQADADAVLNVSLGVASGQYNDGQQGGGLVGLALLPFEVVSIVAEGVVTGEARDRDRCGAGGFIVATLLEGGTNAQLWQRQAKVHIPSLRAQAKDTEPLAEAELVRQVMAVFPRADQ